MERWELVKSNVKNTVLVSAGHRRSAVSGGSMLFPRQTFLLTEWPVGCETCVKRGVSMALGGRAAGVEDGFKVHS